MGAAEPFGASTVGGFVDARPPVRDREDGADGSGSGAVAVVGRTPRRVTAAVSFPDPSD